MDSAPSAPGQGSAPLSDPAFVASVNARWESFVVEHNRRGFRVCVVLALVLYPAFHALDRVVVPESWMGTMLAIRVAGMLIVLALLAVHKTHWWERHSVLTTSIFITALAASACLMCVALGGFSSYYYVGVILCMVVGVLFLWPLHAHAITYGVIITLYIAGGISVGTNEQTPDAIVALSFLVTAALILTTGGRIAWRNRREQVEAQLLIEDLERRSRAQRNALARAVAQLEQLDRKKSELFTDISHELRTSLTIMLGVFSRMMDHPETELQRAATVGHRSGARLLTLIGDLLDLARLEAGGSSLRPQTFDLAALVRHTAAAFEDASDPERFDLRLPERLLVRADARLLRTLLTNLLSNAVKFVLGQTPRVQVVLRASGADAHLEVTDNGIGIPASAHARLFERFFQVESSEHGRFEGSGIGLALVREIVETHGGDVSVRSAEMEGATFTVTLPIGAVDPEAVTDLWSATPALSAAAPTAAAGSGPLVLIVEDDADLRGYLRAVLEEENRVVSAEDGLSGLAAARRLRPDAVITDEMMPGMTGSELLDALRADPEFARVPVVFVTAHGDAATRLRILSAGAADLLVKPFHHDELRVRVRNLIANRRVEQELATAVAELELFTSATAHDIRSPLSAISLSATLIEMTYGAKLGEEGLSLLSHIQEGVEWLSSLVGDMLALTGLSRAPMSLAPVELSELVEETRSGLLELLERTGGRLVAGEMPAVMTDRVKLRRLLQNLVANGLKYHRPDTPPVVEVTAALAPRGLEISVRDNGVGFSASQAEEIFQPFLRLGSHTEQGTGLGLTICQRIAERLGGSIRATGTPGVGATFTVTLPSR